MTALFEYQKHGAAHLVNRGRALLADDPGLGKSAQAIAACDELGAKRVLVICPASLRENWRREFRLWQTMERRIMPPDTPAPIEHGTVMVTSYDKAARNADMWREMHYDVLVLDEAHYLKNRKAARTKAIYGKKCDRAGGIADHALCVFALTGTPAPNNPSELWTHIRALAPSLIKSESTKGRPAPFWSFAKRYCHVRDIGFGMEIGRGRNLEELRELIKPFVLRRKKEHVLHDLPPMRFATLALSSERAARELRKIEDPLAVLLRGVPDDDMFATLQKNGTHVAAARRLVGMAKAQPVIDYAAMWLDATDQKLVIFAHHKDVIEAIRLGLNAVKIDGSTTPEARQAAVDAFQNDDSCRVFVGQLQAAGTGLTLTAASNVLFAESSWVPSENEQAAMRIHRIGQANACLAQFAYVPGSLDEQIQRVAANKAADLAKIFD